MHNLLIFFTVYGDLKRLKFFWPYLDEKNPILTRSGLTPLHLLALNGKEDITKFMVENLVNCNPKSRNHDTPLYFARKYGHFKIEKMILHKISQDNA